MPESLNEVRPTVVRPLINRGLDILSRVLNITPTLRANEDQLKSLERKCNSLRTMLQQYAPQLFEPGSDVNAVNSGHAQPLDLDGLVAVEESVLEDLNKVEQAVTRLQGLGRAPRLLALSETNLENAQSRLNNASSQLLMSLLLQKLLYYPQNQQRIARNQTQFLSELQEVVDNVVEANDTPRMLDCLNYIQIALKRWGTDGTYRKPSIQSIRDWQVKGAGFSVVAETTKPRTNIERMGLLTRSMSASSASTTSALSVVAGRRSFSDNIGDTVHSPSSSSSWRPSTRPAAAGRSEVLREPLSEQRTGQGPAVITKSPQYISERWGSAPPRNRFTHHTNGMPKNVTLPFKFRESAKLDELLGYIFHSELDVRIRALVQETLLGTYKMYTTSDVLISAAIRRWNYVKRFGNHVDIPLNFFDQWLKLLQKSQDDRGALEQLAGFLQGLYTTLSDEPLTKQAKDTILLARFARSSAPLAWWTNMPKSNVDFLYLKPDLLADHLTLLANSCHRLIRAPHMLFGLLHEDPTSWVFPLLGSRMLFEKVKRHCLRRVVVTHV
ncbi:hypothetical protein CALVIDRAFT_169776 [Calocera viscosa TUFC12733]|uniref:Uncharacterized protein n=1 Tax=Calocera viscosa (strain TUFC12733) TaxID=1330018 RepID=A0A167L6S0_CALVF|nr:hypothetical protein CALVIDRAFT_169776 [Calocera viscosa TUFC12733]